MWLKCMTWLQGSTMYQCSTVDECFNQQVKLHYPVTFQMLYCVITFDGKWENLPTLVISYKVIINNWIMGRTVECK